MTGEGDLGLTGGPQTYWLKEFTAKVSHVGLAVFSSSTLMEGCSEALSSAGYGCEK